MIRKLTCVLSGILILSSCYYDKEDLLYPDGINCSTVPARFATDVNPIIQTRCAIAGCHAAGTSNGVGPLTSYDLIKNAAVEIKVAVETRFMPQGSSLSQLEIKTISCWVDSGARNN